MKNADLTTLTATFPLVQDLIALKETTWLSGICSITFIDYGITIY